MSEEMRCPYCNKFCNSKSGLTNHMKSCHVVAEPGVIDPRDINPYDTEEPMVVRPEQKPSRTTPTPKSAAGNPFNFGAFAILADHLPLFLDLNFAAALSEHILKHGSENKAVLAFGHQLAKVAGED